MNQTEQGTFLQENVSCADPSYTDSYLVKTTKTTLLAITMTIALFGNLLVIFIVYKNKKMRRTTNIFIANMATSDLFIAVVTIPRIITELYVGPRRWLIGGVIGTISCKLCLFLTDFSLGISFMSHSVIAIDRFCAIVYSLRLSPITPARRKYIIALIWLLIFMLNSPSFYTYRLQKMDDAMFCVTSWYPLDTKVSQMTFFSVILAIEFGVPILLMTVLYTWLIISLTSQKSLSTQSLHMRKIRRKEDIRVLRKVLTLLVVFLVSVIPITLLGVFLYYQWDFVLPCWAWSFAFVVHLLFLSNSAVNPCLCIALNASYKHYIQKLLCPSKYSNTRSSPGPSTQRKEGKELSDFSAENKQHFLLNER
ncbi:QRFP-like peptide receptor [Actinia tenebrosa]|uniref:QRFP-like peptide receptor n=1 Tax=Actinia tenebrosa TaxID=6105 RepID=A0A6P8I922_ACTTE|nr:QRFP-like peptide receptor [Actinia tenebrosa]XP_031561593.1 QRFP-like peptide receptor [Actinia tenebrosa]XP_031561594.1 QRFP-like peptide receptor [Actinia tenebrosa]XP_031561595.1 QRFP-like peptide receptor [Actinia tenebrosa]XP_031561597.1 QRFP-like peptide receptor [Actinia tenebrosa]XP_031561598.1 QRFP-like peptide receptor [Actinia tenebrosa]